MWFQEELHTRWYDRGYAQGFTVTKELFRQRTEFQDMVIFETPSFGRVLALDGIVQTTEKDEFVYHEMMAHVPIVAHGNAKNVLIIGGGDGGVLREVLRHKDVRAVMVEIDRTVVDLCTEHMPSLSDGAFSNPRGELVIADGLKYVAETARTFDAIIVDSTDPIGPGEVLFTETFYGDCKRALTPGGILITQSGVPYFQREEMIASAKRLRPHFKDVGFYVISSPTYAGGMMALGWASDNPALRRQSVETIAGRIDVEALDTKYYTPEIHVGAFALPRYLRQLVKGL